jgi:uncharacterized protein
MNLAGSYAFHAPRDRVFAAICDPHALMAVIPGCEAVEQTGPDEYEGRITLRLPGAVGSYRTRVRLVDTNPPERSGMDGRLEGSMGSIAGHAEFVLAEADGGTAMQYRGTATIQGPLARLDSGFAERLAQSLIGQGLKALDQRLATEVPQ